MKTENSRKYSLIFSGILLGFQYLGVVIDANIPFTQIKISSQANIPIVLTVLIVFFGGQFSFYWLKQRREDRNFFDFITCIPVALFAIAPVCYGFLNKFGIDWKVISSLILIFYSC
jgi:phage shock protein PspC (stress-responsive transcriptional regulator)